MVACVNLLSAEGKAGVGNKNDKKIGMRENAPKPIGHGKKIGQFEADSESDVSSELPALAVAATAFRPWLASKMQSRLERS
jgi:hypothetical protein